MVKTDDLLNRIFWLKILATLGFGLAILLGTMWIQTVNSWIGAVKLNDVFRSKICMEHHKTQSWGESDLKVDNKGQLTGYIWCVPDTNTKYKVEFGK